MKENKESVLRDCRNLLISLQNTYDLSEHSEEVEKVVEAINKIVVNTIKSKKKSKKDWEANLIESWFPIFDEFPELMALPIYSWGQYYKYECAGEAFECNDMSFVNMMCDITNNEEFDEELLKQLDVGIEKKYIKCGNKPTRKEAVKYYGGDHRRGGLCLVINKDEKGTFVIKAIDCDSPE